MSDKQKTANNLKNQLLQQLPEQFTGKLEVVASKTSWTLFFCLGRLAWATGGPHLNRRFHRLWHQYCSNISLANLKLRAGESVSCYYYNLLSVLSRREMLKQEQTKALVISTLKEVLFDIIQQEEKEKLTYKTDTDGAIEKSSILMFAVVTPDNILPSVEELWLQWKKAGLAVCSPNLVPVISQPEQLQQATKPATYQTLVKLVNGKNSLREVAALIKKDLQNLTLSIIPYVRKKLIQLKETPDKHRVEGSPALVEDAVEKTQKATEKKLSTIACVDDSPQVCQLLEKIMNKGGYKFVGVQDSVQALPILIEAKPDLIFLDLVMPIANGYEICTQLRRVSLFEQTPIIILTGNDGVVDRVRAKMVGATGFMTKPIEAKKVLAVVRKYLKLAQNPDFQKKATES